MGKIMINDINFSGGGPQIDDTTTSNSTTWSSNQTNTEITKVAHNSADEYDSTRTSSNKYNKGDLCIYENTLYKCNADAGTYGPFDSSKWSSTTLSEELDLKEERLTPVVLNNTLTYHSNCTIQNGVIIRYGRIVEVGMILKATGNINNNDILVSGLPRALQNRRCPRGIGTDQWFANTDYTSGGLALDADETDQTKAIIRNFSNITASTSSPRYIYLSFSYVTMS